VSALGRGCMGMSYFYGASEEAEEAEEQGMRTINR
jgi:hypothetical protein